MKKTIYLGISLISSFVIFSIIIYYMYSSLNAEVNEKRSFEVVDEIPTYSVNGNGKTYGNGPYPAGEIQEPDLIRAHGVNGVEGYVKSSDMSPSFSTPEEALAYQKEIEKVGYLSIPLYESDGKTVIGEFTMFSSPWLIKRNLHPHMRVVYSEIISSNKRDNGGSPSLSLFLK